MYRSLFPVLLCTVVTSAPQEAKNSDITYVKIQPVKEENTEARLPFRESRIENLPLTIPGIGKEIVTERETTEREAPEREAPERDTTDRQDFNVSRITEPDDVINDEIDDRSAEVENASVTSPERKIENQRHARSDDTTASYETDTIPTTVTEEDLKQTEVYETRTKAPSPRFISKLSYFQKNDLRSSIATNLVERIGKRKFKSKCRCEKIWNCPKLQITVPRCPNEYFMCCF